MSLPACGGSDEDGEQATDRSDASASAPSPSPTTTSGEQDAGTSDGTPIRIAFGDTELNARLERLPEGASATIEAAR